MTEKRFVGNFQGTMLVSVKDTERDCNVNILQIVEIANGLVGENEQLKQLLDYADDLIQSHLSEHFVRQWENMKGDVE